ncbi:MAG TPA: histidine kinase, partial [Micromonosporaceae bacterium]|nr:histidine kinase [Micromonosporaceae bacterium]
RAGTVWAVAAFTAVAWRLVRSSPARLRTIGPVALCALGYLASIVAYYAVSLGRGFLGSDSIDRRLWLVQAVLLCLLAGAVPAYLVRSRLTHRELTRLVIDLGTATAPGRLRQAIAGRLGDPDLVIAYPVDGGSRHVNVGGLTVDTRPSGAKTATQLRHRGSDIATLIHRRGLLDTPGAVDDLVSATHLGLENERLHAEVVAQLADLRASGARIVAAGDDERRRLERDLHDGAQQRLVGLSFGLRMLRRRAGVNAVELDIAEAELQETISDLRQLARGLFPVLLKDAGLTVALTALSQARRLQVGRVPQGRFPGVVESTVYLLVARAGEHRSASVTVEVVDGELLARVLVDGEVGDLGDLSDRVTTLAGRLTVRVGRGGTELTLALPLAL